MDADMGAADEDADLQLALQMSMTENMDATTTPAPAEGSGLNQVRGQTHGHTGRMIGIWMHGQT